MSKFNEALAAVLLKLGITNLEKKDGKSVLSEKQRTILSEKYGETFVEQFVKDLNAQDKEADPKSDEEIEKLRNELEKKQQAYDDLKSKLEASAEKEKNLNEMIHTLSDSAEDDLKAETPKGVSSGRSFTPDMAMLHNQVLDNVANGDGTKAFAGDTIVTDDLKKEFGKYVSDRKYEIITLLFGKLSCTECMTTKMSEKTEWQAIESQIDDLIQKFTPYWTPSGTVKFTPLKISNRKHKINAAFKPAVLMEDVIGYLYDEGLQPKDMPITKYIINVLIKPKVEEERDILLATGEYDETANAGKKDYEEGTTGKSMDGFVTVLKRLHADASVNMVRLLNGVELTRGNIYNEFDKIYKQMPVKYRTKKLDILIDPDLLNLYDLARDDKFPNSKNEDENKQRLQHTNFIFKPLDGMTGTGCFFITPKENFIRLLSKNKGASKIWIEGENYDVKIFAEWWEAVGFAIAELLFGYVPPVTTPEGSAGSQSA